MIRQNLRGIALLVFLVGFALLGAETSSADSGNAGSRNKSNFGPHELEPLVASLQAHGFPSDSLQRIFSDKRLKRIQTVVNLNAINRDDSRDYGQYMSRYALRKAEQFRKRNFGQLWRVEDRFGVPMNVILAILLVETQMGTARLPFRVLDVFTTLVIEGHPDSVDKHYEKLLKHHPDLEKGFLAERLAGKAEWAFDELVALLILGQETGRDVFDIRGSYAGALGMPQFLPSSYHRWAVDGNNDRQIDLENRADAIASIGNYLRAHGWTKTASYQQKWRAVWEYNHSPNYVNAVLNISRKLDLPLRKKIRRG